MHRSSAAEMETHVHNYVPGKWMLVSYSICRVHKACVLVITCHVNSISCRKNSVAQTIGKYLLTVCTTHIYKVTTVIEYNIYNVIKQRCLPSDRLRLRRRDDVSPPSRSVTAAGALASADTLIGFKLQSVTAGKSVSY